MDVFFLQHLFFHARNNGQNKGLTDLHLTFQWRSIYVGLFNASRWLQLLHKCSKHPEYLWVYHFLFSLFVLCSEFLRVFARMATSEQQMFSNLLWHVQDMGGCCQSLHVSGCISCYIEGQFHSGGPTAVASWARPVNNPNLCWSNQTTCLAVVW